MAERVCPPWMGYLLINPLRKLLEKPDKLLGQFVEKGMTVLEPGSGMGYFTLPLARMVGPEGRVVAVEIQPKMLAVLERRAHKACLAQRIEFRQAKEESLDVADLAGAVDFVAALHVVHEVPDQISFFTEVKESLKPERKLLVVEPRGHVSEDQFTQTLLIAEEIGFELGATSRRMGGRVALLTKSASTKLPEE